MALTSPHIEIQKQELLQKWFDKSITDEELHQLELWAIDDDFLFDTISSDENHLNHTEKIASVRKNISELTVEKQKPLIGWAAGILILMLSMLGIQKYFTPDEEPTSMVKNIEKNTETETNAVSMLSKQRSESVSSAALKKSSTIATLSFDEYVNNYLKEYENLPKGKVHIRVELKNAQWNVLDIQSDCTKCVNIVNEMFLEIPVTLNNVPKEWYQVNFSDARRN